MAQRGIKVTVYDPDLHKSRSITVYGAHLVDVTRRVESDLGRRWRTTSFTDRRHKRR